MYYLLSLLLRLPQALPLGPIVSLVPVPISKTQFTYPCLQIANPKRMPGHM